MDQVPMHAMPTEGIEGASVSADGESVLLRFVGAPIGVTVPRSTLVNLVALAIDASAERLGDAGDHGAVRAVRVGRFTVGTAGERVVLSLETETGAGAVSFDLPEATARQLAGVLNAMLAPR